MENIEKKEKVVYNYTKYIVYKLFIIKKGEKDMKTIKIFFAIMIVVITIAILSNVVLAYNPGNISGTHSGSAATQVKSVGQRILGVIQIVGTIASILTLVILGVKYMTGSVEEKAEYKKTLMPYLIGAVFVLGATNITSWIYSASQGLFN